MIVAVVPAKDLNGAKARLAGLLTAEERRLLALAMLEDVLTTLRLVEGLDGILVVTREREITALARDFKAEVLEEPGNRGHTAAILAATRELVARGARALLTLPGDVPGVSPSEVKAMLGALGPAPASVLVPSRDGLGTNGVLLAPPDALPLRFGEPSFGNHLAAARRLNLRTTALRLPGVALDIDRPDDLLAFLRTPTPTRTYRELIARGIVARLHKAPNRESH